MRVRCSPPLAEAHLEAREEPALLEAVEGLPGRAVPHAHARAAAGVGDDEVRVDALRPRRGRRRPRSDLRAQQPQRARNLCVLARVNSMTGASIEFRMFSCVSVV